MAAASLILAAEAAEAAEPFLFSDEELPKIGTDRARWHCTGEYLWRKRPEVYKSVLDMLAEPGIPVDLVCRTLRVSHHTVSSIVEREGANLADRKKGILRTITRGLRLCAERVEELAPAMTAKDALIGVGILGEKMQLLAGDVTARIELVRPHEGILERMARLRAELIGTAAENGAQNALAAPGGDPGAGDAVATLKSAGSDLESDAFPAVSLVDLPPAADLAAFPDGRPAAGCPSDGSADLGPETPDGGGRGLKSEEGGVDVINGRVADNFIPKGGSDS